MRQRDCILLYCLPTCYVAFLVTLFLQNFLLKSSLGCGSLQSSLHDQPTSVSLYEHMLKGYKQIETHFLLNILLYFNILGVTKGKHILEIIRTLQCLQLKDC